MSQLALDLTDLVTPDYAPEATIQERYEAWIAANPWVLPWMADHAHVWMSNGGRRISVKHLAAIELMPDLAEVIETRELRSA